MISLRSMSEVNENKASENKGMNTIYTSKSRSLDGGSGGREKGRRQSRRLFGCYRSILGILLTMVQS